MERWQFPNVAGCIDGKHVAIKAPRNTGSLFFNYKGFFSIVLLAVADAKYRFIYVNVGSEGRTSDGGIFASCDLRKALDTESANLPAPRPLPNDDQPMPFTFIGDEAFPLKSYLLKPYPQRHLTHEQRIYNYRLCRARRVVENAFGIMASRLHFLLSFV